MSESNPSPPPATWNRLYRKLAAAGLSRGDLARKTGYSLTYIGYLERGVKQPTRPVVYAFANAIGCTPADLDTTADGEDLTLEIIAAQHADLGDEINKLKAHRGVAA